MMTRRQALKTTLLTTAAFATVRGAIAQPSPSGAPAGPFTLPALPYAFDALEPHIDARTMEIHHDRHHKAYVDNLNKAVADAPDLAKKSVEDLLKDLNSVPEKIRTAVRNHGGGHYNHSLFWQMMKKGGGGAAKGELAVAIEKNFGTLNKLRGEFNLAAMGVFGSGWVWLALQDGKLTIQRTANQDNPVSQGAPPILGLDVWEHAYYLKYENKRADYIAAWWNVVNWEFAAHRYEKLKS